MKDIVLAIIFIPLLLLMYFGLPYLSCLGFVYGNGKDTFDSTSFGVRFLCFVLFLLSCAITYIAHILNPERIIIITPNIYDFTVFPLLPILIFSITIFYTIYKKNKVIIKWKYYILFILLLLIADWQYLSIIQIEASSLTKSYLNEEIVYIMTWKNIIPFLVTNVLLITTVFGIIKLYSAKIRQKAGNS